MEHRFRPGRTLRLLAAALAAVLLWLPFFSFVEETAQVFWPRRSPLPADATVGLPFAVETVRFPAEDGVILEGWLAPGRAGGHPIILCHGSGGNRTEMVPYAAFLAEAGYPLLLLDFRAHGGSGGQLMSLGYRETWDVAAAVRFLQTRPEVDARQVGALGISLGAAAVVVAAAAQPELKAVVADSTYARYTDVMQRFFHPDKRLGLPMDGPAIGLTRLLFGENAVRFAPVDAAPRVSPRALFIIHGKHDNGNTTVEDARAVYAAAGEPKEFWLVPDAGHVQALSVAGQEYRRRVVGFFRQYLDGLP